AVGRPVAQAVVVPPEVAGQAAVVRVARPLAAPAAEPRVRAVRAVAAQEAQVAAQPVLSVRVLLARLPAEARLRLEAWVARAAQRGQVRAAPLGPRAPVTRHPAQAPAPRALPAAMLIPVRTVRGAAQA